MSELIEELAATFEAAELELSHGQHVVRLKAEDLVPFAEAAKAAGFEVCVDVTAVDWLGVRRERFEVVINLLSMEHGLRLRLRVPLSEPKVASVTPIWPGAGFAEREAFDMFGIEFEGHPDLSRILMPDDWEGHPLRKDYGVGSVPVQFKASNKVT